MSTSAQLHWSVNLLTLFSRLLHKLYRQDCLRGMCCRDLREPGRAVSLRKLYTLQQQVATAPSKAMRRAYDSGLCPQPASVAALGDVWGPAHREWTETWLRLLRRLSHEATEALTELRCTAVAAAERQSQQAAIARFWSGGEIRRLLRPQIPGLLSPLLRCDAPDTLQVAGSAASLDRFVDRLHVGRVSHSANLGLARNWNSNLESSL